MREYKLHETMQNFTSKIICNKCGQVFDLEEGYGLETWQAEFMHQFKLRFGYASNHDTEDWKFDLCENCIEEIAKDFKIPPEITNYL